MTIHSNKGFYIGDPCYALGDNIYRGIWGDKYNYWTEESIKVEAGTLINDKESLKEDLSFLVRGTHYGDGSYLGSNNFEYGVDSGTLSIIPLELIKPEVIDGTIHLGYTSAEMGYEDGIFIFKLNGEELEELIISIDTLQEYEIEEEDYDYDLDSNYCNECGLLLEYCCCDEEEYEIEEENS